MSRQSDFITEARQHVRAVWEGLRELKELQAEWNALAYGSNLADGVGDNAGITRAFVGSAVFDTTDVLLAELTAGHDTNYARLL